MFVCCCCHLEDGEAAEVTVCPRCREALHCVERSAGQQRSGVIPHQSSVLVAALSSFQTVSEDTRRRIGWNFTSVSDQCCCCAAAGRTD